MENEVYLRSRMELDALLVNVETAVRINKRTEFFSWVQGVLQGLIPHEVLVCGLPFPSMSGLRFDWVASFPIASDRFAEMCRGDGGLIHQAVDLWLGSGGVPLLGDAEAFAGCGGEYAAFGLQLRNFDLDNIVAHGLPGLDGRPAAFFAFFKSKTAPSMHEGRMAVMLLPYLHASWLRVNCNNEAQKSHEGSSAPLSNREIEVLEWMQKGKSNGEIAQILGISQPTVKNHVQKILRKLGVHNRTQAVAMGLSLSITQRRSYSLGV